MSSPPVSNHALSPLDGRYREQLQPLALIFSEQSLVLHRIRVELHWLLQLAANADPGFAVLAEHRDQLEQFSAEIESLISNRTNCLPEIDEIYSDIKRREKTTRHDVKAVEYWLQDEFARRKLQPCSALIHFACTSEDINSTAWGCMLKLALDEVLLPGLGLVEHALGEMAEAQAATAMLARTHGQSASPTTLGKEVAVWCSRLRGQTQHLGTLLPSAKFSGATGNYNAHHIALPHLDWPLLCRQMVEALGLDYNGCTTQVEPGDRLAEICHCLLRINRILTDLSRDFWGYISLGYLHQRPVAGEVGSSTMPHKINPIDFENAEGNMAIAHAMLEKLAGDLPVSRWQRDLSGSTLQRNLGAALGHCSLAWQSIRRGLERVAVDERVVRADLQIHTEVLVEAVQTAMRLTGDVRAYEQMQQLSKGGRPDAEQLRAAIQALPGLDEATRKRLLDLSPENYTGLAEILARQYAAD